MLVFLGCAETRRHADTESPTRTGPKPAIGMTARGSDDVANDVTHYLVAGNARGALAMLEGYERSEAPDLVALRLVALCALERESEALTLAVSVADRSVLQATKPAGDGPPNATKYRLVEMMTLDRELLARNHAAPCGDRVSRAYRNRLDDRLP